jgi:hypothetical protein
LRDDVGGFRDRVATKDDLAALEARMATKDDLAALEARMATKDDLAALEARMATKDDLAVLGLRIATKDDVATLRGDIEQVQLRVDGIDRTLSTRMDAMDNRISRLRSAVYILAKDEPAVKRLLGD